MALGASGEVAWGFNCLLPPGIIQRGKQYFWRKKIVCKIEK